MQKPKKEIKALIGYEPLTLYVSSSGESKKIADMDHWYLINAIAKLAGSLGNRGEGVALLKDVPKSSHDNQVLFALKCEAAKRMTKEEV